MNPDFKYEYVIINDTKDGINVTGALNLNVLVELITLMARDKKAPPFRAFTKSEADALGLIPTVTCVGTEEEPLIHPESRHH